MGKQLKFTKGSSVCYFETRSIHLTIRSCRKYIASIQSFEVDQRWMGMGNGHSRQWERFLILNRGRETITYSMPTSLYADEMKNIVFLKKSFTNSKKIITFHIHHDEYLVNSKTRFLRIKTNDIKLMQSKSYHKLK